jgi:hypothetical protein
MGEHKFVKQVPGVYRPEMANQRGFWRMGVGCREGVAVMAYLPDDVACAFCGVTSLAGSVGFKSHLHTGHRVASVYTIRPKTAHFALGQIFVFMTQTTDQAKRSMDCDQRSLSF